ncbi:MAG: hypothetical protein GY940_04280 [bacterium]|nr:hypothetical protein [bacterium]
MSFEIQTITIKDPISETTIPLSRKGKLIPPCHPIWFPGIRLEPQGSPFPAAFRIAPGHVAPLEVIVSVPDGVAIPLLELQGCIDNRLLFQSRGPSRLLTDGTVAFDVSSITSPGEFTRLSGEPHWYLSGVTGCPGEQLVQLGKTYLELYWLYGYDCTLFRRGVAVEVLRDLAYVPPSGQKVCPRARTGVSGVLEAAVEACFFRNPPLYDTLNKESHYLLNISFDEPLTFKLRQYLSAVHDLSTRLNCYDTAAAVQLYLKAAGLDSAKFCYFEHFGYVRLTRLVGRGDCNNPNYLENRDYMESHLVTDPVYHERKGFNNHSICVFPLDTEFRSNTQPPDEDRYLALDACIGPHTGDQTIRQYLTAAVDDILPSESHPPPTSKPGICTGVTHIDWCPAPKKEPNLPLTTAFKEIVGYSQFGNHDDHYFVVCPWPHPKNCPVLDEHWNTRFYQVVAGNHEARKTWRLEKKGAQVQIDIYVTSQPQASSAAQSAQYRFLALGSHSSNDAPPYIKGPPHLGRYSAMTPTQNSREFLWTLYNVTFHVTYHNTTFNIHALNSWLTVMAYTYRVKSLHRCLPSFSGIGRPNKTFKAGEPITIGLIRTDEVFLDFIYKECNGIRLIRETQATLTFDGIKESKNKLTLAAVNQETLIVNNKDIKIRVKKKARF